MFVSGFYVFVIFLRLVLDIASSWLYATGNSATDFCLFDNGMCHLLFYCCTQDGTDSQSAAVASAERSWTSQLEQ